MRNRPTTLPTTLIDQLERAADVAECGLRFVARDESATWLPWSEILERARHTCGGLQALGVRPRDRVALVFPTGPQFFDGYFGTLLAGAVPVPLYPPVRLGRLDEYHRQTAAMLGAVDARLVLTDRRVRRILGESIEAASPELGCRTLETLPDGAMTPVESSSDDLGLVQFSSGTTTDPKPVALSHRAIMAQASILNGFWPDNDEIRHSGTSWLPLYHDMGLIGCVMPALERPAVLNLLPPEAFVARPALWLRTISRYGSTVSPAPNFAYSLCLERVRDDELEGVDLDSWRVALNGAEPVVPSVLRAFTERFGRWGLRPEALTPVYGLSEASLAVTFSALDRPASWRRFDREQLTEQARAVECADGVEITSVGRPLPGFELRVEDGYGRMQADGEVGRLKVRGPSLMDGYLDRPEQTAAALRDGWLDTGDLGFLHEGELFLTGRAKDLLILRGRNHAPDEVERTVDGVPGVRTGCAVAVSWLPEEASGEVLLVLVEAARGTSRREFPRIAEACREAVLSGCGLASERIVVLEAGTLPRTSSGKLRRQEALRRYLSDTLTPPKRVNLLRIAGALARSRLAYARSPE